MTLQECAGAVLYRAVIAIIARNLVLRKFSKKKNAHLFQTILGRFFQKSQIVRPQAA
jgi:hypothetical protein